MLVAWSMLCATGCALPPRGALYRAVVAPGPQATAVPSGASVAQYYAVSAFRVADELASASNAVDQGLADRAQGEISDAYLALIAHRSAVTAQHALNDADQLAAPPGMQADADSFFTAAVSLADAVDATQQALDAPGGTNTAQLITATQQRQKAARALEASLNTLLAAGWGPKASR